MAEQLKNNGDIIKFFKSESEKLHYNCTVSTITECIGVAGRSKTIGECRSQLKVLLLEFKRLKK